MILVRTRVRARVRARIRTRVGVGFRVRREVFNMNHLGIELSDGVCDFQKVPAAQLCPSAKRD